MEGALALVFDAILLLTILKLEGRLNFVDTTQEVTMHNLIWQQPRDDWDLRLKKGRVVLWSISLPFQRPLVLAQIKFFSGVRMGWDTLLWGLLSLHDKTAVKQFEGKMTQTYSDEIYFIGSGDIFQPWSWTTQNWIGLYNISDSNFGPNRLCKISLLSPGLPRKTFMPQHNWLLKCCAMRRRVKWNTIHG